MTNDIILYILVDMNLRRILSQIALVTGALLFSVGLQTFAAFTEPTTSTSDAGAFAPITTGPNGQVKSGGLVLNTGGAANGLIVQDGNVGIGTAVPGSALSVNGGISVGKYSDIAAPSKELKENTLRENGMIISGDVGIGTTSPGIKLSVAGGVQIGDDTSSCTAEKVGTLRLHNDSLQVCENFVANTTIVTQSSSSCNTGCPGGRQLYCISCGGTCRSWMCEYTKNTGHDYRWFDIKMGPY